MSGQACQLRGPILCPLGFALRGRRLHRVSAREEANLSEPVTPDAELTGIDDLLLPFHNALKPRAQWLIGTEAEKPGLLSDSLAPLPFEGPRSVKRVFELLQARFGWHGAPSKLRPRTGRSERLKL